jgi:hypothetical protein
MLANQEMSMDIIRDLRLRDLQDPRPWYEKHSPWMKPGQKIKVVLATEDSLLKGRELSIRNVVAKWIRRLSSTVDYDLKEKLFLFEELWWRDVALGEKKYYARVRGYRDQTGGWVANESQDERARRGDYLLVEIELFSTNWSHASPSLIEDCILHELLHVVRPGIARFMENGIEYEDEAFMHRTTRKLIRDFRRLGKTELDALIEESRARTLRASKS